LSESGDEAEEVEIPDEVDESEEEEIPDEVDEALDEDFFNPNDEALDEDILNPNSGILDEDFFNPNVDKSDENLNENFFNPNVDESDERFHEEYFDPNVDPSDERFHEEYFDPNVDPSDERFHEENFDPNVDPSDERFHEEYFDPNVDEIDELSDEQGNDYNDENLEFDPSLDNDADEIKNGVADQLGRDEKNSEEDMEEVNSNVESENLGPEQSTLILHQESQEPISRDEEGNIILDADTLEFFGEHVSSKEEMEVEILEEGLEELFNSYEEQYLEQEEGSVTSHELEQETNEEHQETERTFHIERQEEKEALQETSQKSIQEIKRDLTQEKEISLEQNQESEQEFIQEIQPILKEMDVKERYKRETGRRPIYAGKETKGFIEWKEQFKQHKQEQEQKNLSLNEKEKESKERQEEFRESREEWAEYLAISIKESEFPEEIKEKFDHFLDKYEKLRELLKKVKTKEISEEAYEKEVKEFEHILIEERQIARPLFMNFDWFRRYYKETIRKSGKRVAKLYISKKTREFLSYISVRIEQLRNSGNFHENAEKFEEFLEKSFQIREKWALLLKSLIHEVPNNEVSEKAKKELKTVIKIYCKIRAILFSKNILKEDKEKLIQSRIVKYNRRYFELFEVLKRFLGIHDSYSRNWMEQSLISQGKKTVRILSQKLEGIKEEAVQEILNGDNSILHKFKEILRENLYKSTELKMNEKSKLLKIIQKKDISEEDRKIIKSLLGRLSKRELITILQNDFKNYFQNLLPKPKNNTSPQKNPKLDSQNNVTSNSNYLPTEKEKKSSFLIQNVYEERVHIQPKRLKELFQTILKNKSHNSIRKLGYEIGISQDKHLNGKGSSMSLESFNKLQNLLDFDLKITKDYTIKKPVVSTIVLEKSKELANLIGIILGDANVSKKRSKIRIYLNRYEDSEMVNHTREIIRKIFNYNTYDDTNGKVVVLSIYSLAIVNALNNVGIICGNKILNQVGIPEWIFEKKEYIIACLKGLLDTDGSIYVSKKSRHFRISFGSASKPLVAGFIKLCKLINIGTSRIIEAESISKITKKLEIAWITQITKIEDVINFLDIVNPIKWNDKDRRSYWGYQLIYINSNSSIIKSIEQEIENLKRSKETKVFVYTLENLQFLKKLMNNYFSTSQITLQKREDAILKALSYSYSHYSKKTGLNYMHFLEKYGSYPAIKTIMIKNNEKIVPEPHTLYKYIENLFDEIDIVNQYGNDAYNRWSNSNIEILIDIQNQRIFRCSLVIRQEICKEIFNLIYDKDYLNLISNSFIRLYKKKPTSIFSLFEFIIMYKDLNDNIIIDEDSSNNLCFPTSKINILKFGRFSELLNSDHERLIIEEYIHDHINLIKVVFKYFKEKKKIVFNRIKNDANINWGIYIISKIINSIENSSNIQFNI